MFGLTVFKHECFDCSYKLISIHGCFFSCVFKSWYDFTKWNNFGGILLCPETKESSLKFERRRLLRRRLLDLLLPKQRPRYSGCLMPGLCPVAAGKAGNAVSQQLELNFICYACKERNLMGGGKQGLSHSRFSFHLSWTISPFSSTASTPQKISEDICS